jgi:magnesium-transporting ATPase (P-type)
MLTGDKGLTAKSIGVSCGLLSKNLNSETLFQMKDDLTASEVESEIKSIITKSEN